jgi:calcium-independent phospholipase A2-gamma
MTENIIEEEREIKIVVVDGGGIRGIIPMVMYMEICDQLEDENLMSKFDLVCGTSTGSILTAAMLLKGKTPKEGLEIFKKMGPEIFGYTFGYYTFGVFSTLFGNGSWYSTKKLKNIFEREFGETLLSEVAPGTVLREGHTIPHWCCISTKITTDQYTPFVFRNYQCPVRKGTKDKNGLVTNSLSQTDGTNLKTETKIHEAVLSSCVAPTYFEPAQVHGYTFSDGGIVANCPARLAYYEAKYLWPDNKVACVVSLGTGKPKVSGGKSKLTSVVKNIVGSSTNSELLWDDFNTEVGIHKEVIKTFRFNPPDLGDEKLDETDPNQYERWIVQTKTYMRSSEVKKKIQELKRYL